MALVTITRGPWIIDTTTITSVTRDTLGNVIVIANGITYLLTLAEATQLNVAISSVAGYIPQVPPVMPSQPFIGTSPFNNSRIMLAGVQSVDDRAVVFAWGLATTDAAIVTDIGADALYADGSLYLSTVGGAGLLFQKTNDVWLAASGGAFSGALQYRGALTQASTAAPVFTGTNGLGQTMTWARTSNGLYTLTAGAATFTANKTLIFIGNNLAILPATTFDVIGSQRTSTTVITVQTSLVTLSAGPPPTGVATDGILNETPISILVLP